MIKKIKHTTYCKKKKKRITSMRNSVWEFWINCGSKIIDPLEHFENSQTLLIQNSQTLLEAPQALILE